MAQPGFMVFTADWAGLLEDYDSEEIGELFKAVLRYFDTGELTDFDDRGMRQFFRQVTKSIDLDRERYDAKCAQNAYNRYRRTCKERKEKPLDMEQWFTIVYSRKPP